MRLRTYRAGCCRRRRRQRPRVLAGRLAARARETVAGITKRLAREAAELPESLQVTYVPSDRPLEDTVAEIEALYFPERL